MFKNLKFNYMFLFLLGFTISLTPEKISNSIDSSDFNVESVLNQKMLSLDLTNLSSDGLTELASKTKNIAEILENSSKIKKLNEPAVTDNKIYKKSLIKVLDSIFLNNFIVTGVRSGLRDGVNNIVKTQIVPLIFNTLLTLAIISKITGIPFASLVSNLWNSLFPGKVDVSKVPTRNDYVKGPFGAYAMGYDIVVDKLINGFNFARNYTKSFFK
ncbi:MAG: hypothetical protein SZ59_C0003G0020 [candidate division TM6 bacterium GW2011_GWF2_28_16]|nr:MAG: hypothetical protein SZ59_C0003G0020 [candidate division TM6 bacterium GW2011_GWF2_28_16]